MLDPRAGAPAADPGVHARAKDPVRQIAEAVLYEGYVLWPYRKSALKNHQRWTFGGVFPEVYSKARGEDDRWWMQTQCLIEADGDAAVAVGVRFLHVVDRKVARRAGEELEFVDELEAAGQRHVSWEEAAEREVKLPTSALASLEGGHRLEIDIPAGGEEEELLDHAGERAGALVRSWRSIRGEVEITAEPRRDRLFVLTVRIANHTPWEGGSREEALKQTLVSTHTSLRVEGGELVSLTDPPEALRQAAEECENVGTWPVMVGEQGERGTVLSSPIILSDYPQVAPESPGDMFDGGEIDQLLVLNILSLTDEEKQEMRDSDPKAHEILERTESLSNEQIMQLHGAVRDFRVLRPG